VTRATKAKLRAAWTPARRKAQAERMRALVTRKRERKIAAIPEKVKPPSPQRDAILYLQKAKRDPQNSDLYCELALRTLLGRLA